MTEISKMYENAGFLKKQCKDYSCIVCEYNNFCEKYPPFTAEKQLELIKWFAIKGNFDTSFDVAKNTYNFWTMYFAGERWTAEGFEETLAGLINILWQDLTDPEKDEIRNILNA